ncbi:unnamed protein product [Heligmosomoides polygyrus]|uniref:C2H2-type domain-containing protein n=1 Tax=Heligmosomoides polygyrus TaxID=6339 RepID=A0A183G715_HELPZ|nr:unnamed protein product [Heligmosomoides polygyrus]
MSEDYDRQHERYFFVRLMKAIEALAGVPFGLLSSNHLEGWISSLLRECSTAYNVTCGEVVVGHRRGEVRGFGTAASYLTPCGKCTKRPHTVLTHLKDRHGATLLHPELHLLSVPQRPKAINFALEQLIVEFPRIRQPEYDTKLEKDDEQVRERSRADLDELQEIYRQNGQRHRNPP